MVRLPSPPPQKAPENVSFRVLFCSCNPLLKKQAIKTNLSDEKRNQIATALAKAQSDIKCIQANGPDVSLPEIMRVCTELQGVIRGITLLND